MKAGCLDDDTILGFVHGGLPRSATGDVHRHLSGCSDCCTVVAEAAKYLFVERALSISAGAHAAEK